MKIIRTVNFKKSQNKAETIDMNIITDDNFGNKENVPSTITYLYSRGFPQTQWDPEEPEEINITSIIDKRTGIEVDDDIFSENKVMELSELILQKQNEFYNDDDYEVDFKTEEENWQNQAREEELRDNKFMDILEEEKIQDEKPLNNKY